MSKSTHQLLVDAIRALRACPEMQDDYLSVTAEAAMDQSRLALLSAGEQLTLGATGAQSNPPIPCPPHSWQQNLVTHEVRCYRCGEKAAP